VNTSIDGQMPPIALRSWMVLLVSYYKSLTAKLTGCVRGTFRDLLPFIAGGDRGVALCCPSVSFHALWCPTVPSASRSAPTGQRGDGGATNGERIYRILLSVSVVGFYALIWSAFMRG